MKTTANQFLQVPNSFFLGLGAKKMDSIEMLIYLYLASFCFGDKTQCFPTQERMAKELGIALSTTKDKIRYMTQRGIIRIAGKSRGGKARWNTYEIVHWDELIKLPDWYNIRAKERQKKCSSNERLTVSHRNDDSANQPLQQPPISLSNSRQSDINNTNSIIISNNKNLAAGAAENSLRTSESDESDVSTKTNFPETYVTNKNLGNFSGEENEQLIEDDIDYDEMLRKEDEEYERIHRFDDRHKPRDISKMQFPNATLKEIKDKIYFYFKDKGFNVFGHQKKLYDLKESYLPQLIKGYSFLSYWGNEYAYGDNSLTMFILNLNDFIEQVESERWMYQNTWDYNNQTALLENFIKDNDAFDLRIPKNRELVNNVLEKSNQDFAFNDLTCHWLKQRSSDFRYAAGKYYIDYHEIPYDQTDKVSKSKVLSLLSMHLHKHSNLSEDEINKIFDDYRIQ